MYGLAFSQVRESAQQSIGRMYDVQQMEAERVHWKAEGYGGTISSFHLFGPNAFTRILRMMQADEHPSVSVVRETHQLRSMRGKTKGGYCSSSLP